MKRRTVLGGICSLGATTGCLAQVTPGSRSISERKFTAYDPQSDFYDSAPDVTDPPEITFQPDNNRVQVVGKLFVGSSTCNKAVLNQATFDERSGTLQVVIGSGKKEQSGNPCTGDESADAYRALIIFDQQLPETVKAKEKGDAKDNETTAQNPDTDE